MDGNITNKKQVLKEINKNNKDGRVTTVDSVDRLLQAVKKIEKSKKEGNKKKWHIMKNLC